MARAKNSTYSIPKNFQHILSVVNKAGVRIIPVSVNSDMSWRIKVLFYDGTEQIGQKIFNKKKVGKKYIHPPEMWQELNRVYELVYNKILKEINDGK